MEANILIVEDNEDLCLVLADNLKKARHKVKTAFSGEDALSFLHKQLFDLMLLDVRLPQKNGMEVLKEAHEIDPDLLVVMITAHGTIQSAVEAMKAKHDIKAPCDGVVSAINVKIGDEVDSSKPLLVIS